jgi:hypothetical protein
MVSSASMAGSVSALSRMAGRHRRKLWPLCACTAMATLARAVKRGKIDVI